jgi:hypothetical protein
LSLNEPGPVQGEEEQVLVYTHSAEYKKEKTYFEELVFQPSTYIAEKDTLFKTEAGSPARHNIVKERHTNPGDKALTLCRRAQAQFG